MTIALVNSTLSANSTNTTNTVSIPSTTAGNVLIAAIFSNTTAGLVTISGVTDSASNTWTLVPNTATNAFGQTVLYYLPNNAGGITSVSVHLSFSEGGSDTEQFLVYEFSGVKASPLDQSSNIHNIGAPVGPSLAPTAANSVFIVAGHPKTTDFTSITGWNYTTVESGSAGMAGYLISTDGSAHQAIFNPTGSQNFISSGANFLPTTGVSGNVLSSMNLIF